MRLNWPAELAQKQHAYPWYHPASNICLDFHGDPGKAQLVVYSDGNHHMALMETLQQFGGSHGIENLFYATIPPNNLVHAVKSGAIQLGNLVISSKPHVFIGPEKALQQLVDTGHVATHKAYMKSQGNVLLVRRGNPKNIESINDFLRKDVRLFSPNPAKETVSYQVYFESVMAIAKVSGTDIAALEKKYASPDQVHYGECIHHREAPQAIADNYADVALVYYHLALRYTRIFPSVFDMVFLGEKPAKTLYHPANVISYYHAGMVGDGGVHGQTFMDYLAGEQVTKIYDQHGLYRPEKFV